jgi:hypothetical protein
MLNVETIFKHSLPRRSFSEGGMDTDAAVAGRIRKTF